MTPEQGQRLSLAVVQYESQRVWGTVVRTVDAMIAEAVAAEREEIMQEFPEGDFVRDLIRARNK